VCVTEQLGRCHLTYHACRHMCTCVSVNVCVCVCDTADEVACNASLRTYKLHVNITINATLICNRCATHCATHYTTLHDTAKLHT